MSKQIYKKTSKIKCLIRIINYIEDIIRCYIESRWSPYIPVVYCKKALLDRKN